MLASYSARSAPHVLQFAGVGDAYFAELAAIWSCPDISILSF